MNGIASNGLTNHDSNDEGRTHHCSGQNGVSVGMDEGVDGC